MKAICCLLCYYNDMETVPVPLETEVILQEDYKRRDGLSQAEDLALKSAAAYFGDEMIRWLGIREKVVRSAPTEIVGLETRHMYEDFLYEMENGVYYHFEFESDSISESDLRRFREYEASTVRIYDAPVVTFVICSSRVKILRDRITDGINTYRVRLIRLKDKDADEMLEQIWEKGAGSLTREDIIPLLLSPLMGGRAEQKERILKGIQVLKRGEEIFPKEDVRKMEAILYTFAVKFLDKQEIGSIKEEMAMTILGQMIWDDAMEKGIEKGMEQGLEKGRKEESERYGRLILKLSEENKTDLLIKTASDPAYRESLYKKYGI